MLKIKMLTGISKAGLGLFLALGATTAVAHAGAGDFVLTIPPGPYANQVTFIHFIGPDVGEVVTNSTLDLTWISDGSMPASELFLEFKITADGASHTWSVTGADFGWGSGAGTFTGTLESSLLNGVASHGFFPHSTIDLIIDRVGGGGVTGQFMNSTLSMALQPDGSAYCFGDGTGTACPCSSGPAAAGCGNSILSGARLEAGGHADFADDTFCLLVSGMPSGKPGLCVKGTNQLGGGMGNIVGDGLLCLAPQLRSQVMVSDANGDVVMDNWRGQAFGTYSGVANVGSTSNYQWWYRDSVNPCTGAGFNFSNAWQVDWK
jgi:hypothetical protein